MNKRISPPAAGGQARGIIVGSLFATGWWVYGAPIFGPVVRPVAILAALVLTLALITASVRILQRVRAMPSAAPTEIAAAKHAWRWFWLNLIGEIVLLNVAIALLGERDLQAYWIPAISAVVGLHFLPMAVFFRTRSYWLVGIAMIVGAIVAALLIGRSSTSSDDIVHSEGLANALVLWSSVILAAVNRLSEGKATH